MSLWDWAGEVYGQDPQAWLAMQDEHGANVPFLLWALWAGPGADLARAAAIAREWEETVSGPLRGVRRRLDVGLLREDVKVVELSAERVLLERLEALGSRAEGDALEVLTAACAAWGRPVPREALERLVITAL